MYIYILSYEHLVVCATQYQLDTNKPPTAILESDSTKKQTWALYKQVPPLEGLEIHHANVYCIIYICFIIYIYIYVCTYAATIPVHIKHQKIHPGIHQISPTVQLFHDFPFGNLKHPYILSIVGWVLTVFLHKKKILIFY